ncbi:PLP-dependent aminotransferase family protein [Paenibacillus sp.]|uniref:aminotransferase-like domain-containing protein n=1 Tax=Paenibacillus sp. TaxID=58172 RepID=UPI002D3B8329|nr:PLP-dependent aminotransferase family protein [Paenibacillus sp.]HZG84278.1 PLP-dependent aminotransferase family protein [Paenibacillus sp.]
MLYEVIMESIRRRIEEGTYKPGDKLPTVRALSQQFGCSKSTVVKAYDELENIHAVYSVPKSGYYVVDSRLSRAKPAPDLRKIDFYSAGPDKQAMPYRDFQHCMNQAIDLYKEEMFTYSEIQGLRSLRAELARHLQDLQVFADPDRIVVVSGSQQALHLLISLPFPNGKRNICVEQPTHVAFIDSLDVQGAVAYGIEMTKNGIDLERLEFIFKHHDIKFFYTVTRFHNPTGYSYTNAERRKIVDLAQKYDVYVIEDDYMGDLDADSKQDPMFAYDPSGRVIYTKSFSKVMLPGLRLGAAVIPESMKASFLRAKFASDLHTPVLMQGALEIYLKSGMYRAHVRRMRDMYRRKGMLLQEAFQTFLSPDTVYSGAESGFYSTIELPRPLKAEQLIARMEREQVFLDNAQKMYLPGFAKSNVVRLSVSQVEDEAIAVGVRKIAEGIAELQRERTMVRFK